MRVVGAICDPDWGSVVEIPSGTQDGRAVEDLLRRMHLRPLAGGGGKVVIIAPYLRTGDFLPASFSVRIIREEPKPKLVASYGGTKVAEFAASRNRGRNRA